MKNKKSLTIGFLTIISLVVGFFVMAPVLAQQVNTGIDFGQYTGLVNTDIRIIIAKIIRAALALLGIVVLAYTLYGGYLYLTAGGNADQVKSAKTVLKNAVIGLVIILSAFSITQFIITKLTGAIIGNYCLENPTDHGCFCAANPLDISCGGCTGSCVPPGQVFYSTVAPQGSLPIYNVVLNAQFLSAFGEASFDAATITNDNVQIFKQLGAGSFDTTPYPVTFETVSPSVVAIHPVGYCGEGIVANDCFASSTTYKVVLRNGANGIKSIGGAELDCSNHVCETLFTTGDRYDATAPVVNMVLPGNWAVVGDTIDTTVKASYSDDSGVKGVSFYFKNNQNAITGIRYFTLNPFQPEGEISFPNWTPHLQNAEKAEFGELSASAFDLDNHRATSTVQQIKIVPAYCFNGSLDTDKLEQQVHSLAPEIGPDCGLRSECGACTGDFCDTNFDCAGTYCDLTQHKCVARPKILEVSPLSAGPGSLVTVLGSNFGTTAGGVLFNGTVARVVACPLTGNTPSWYDNGVIVRVPEGSNVSGTLALQTSEYTGVTTDITHFDTTATGDNWGNPAFFNVTTGVLPGLSCVYPRNGEPTTPIEIAGENLGGTKGALRFADLLVDGTDITSWAAQNVHLNVPKIPAQTLSLKAVTSGGLISNALPFTVNPVAEDVLPKIDFVDPSQGPVGTYVTIAGRNFGSTGSVVFKTGPAAATGVAADLPPDLCGNFWTPTQIIIKVPAGINLGEASSLDFYIQVTNNLNDKSNSLKFTVNKEEIKPGLCKITPDNGPATTDVTLLGERFGATTRGAVEYWQSVSSSFNPLTGTQSWTDLQITDKVPAAAKTGGVKIWSAEKSLYSNSLSFKVQNCKEEISKGKTLVEVCPGEGVRCCAGGSCNTSCPEDSTFKSSMFAWSFSSGRFPVVPKVVEQCGKYCVGTSKACNSNADCNNETPDTAKNCQPVTPSPSPAVRWPNSNAVCINAAVKVLFDTTITNNGATLAPANAQDILHVYKCVNGDSNCLLNNAGQVVAGTYNIFAEGSGNGINFSPTANFATGTTYQVVVTTDAGSALGVLFSKMSEDSSCPKINTVFPNKKSAYCFKFNTNSSDALCKIGSVVVSPIVYTTSTLGATLNNLYDATPLDTSNICVSLTNTYDWRWNPSDGTNTNLTPSNYCSVSNKTTGAKVSGLDQDLQIKKQPTTRAETITATWNDDPEHTLFANKIKGTAYLNLVPQRPKIVEYYPNCNSACTNAAVGFKFDIPVQYGNNFSFLKCDNSTCSSYSWVSNSYNFTDSQNLPEGTFAKGVIITASLQNNTLYKIKVTSYTSGNNIYGARSLANVTLDPQFINDGGTGFSWLFRTKDDSAACAIDSVKIEPATSTVNVIGATANYYSTPLGKPDACSAQGQILSKDVNGFPFDWAWDSQYHPVAVVSQVDKGERLLGSTTLSEYCGDNVVTPSKEDCDSLTASCSPNCRLTTVGTQACTATNKVQCCGNGGAPEYGEECDFGPLNGVPGSTCTFNCLNKKIPISLNYCLAKNTSILNLTARKADCLGRWGAVAVCGNGGTVEDGEECDLGSARNGNVGENCSNTCLLKAKVFGSATGQCGDKIVNSANNEQCDGQLECGADCQWTFKGDGKIDPDQYAKAVGLGTVDAHNQQKTPVTASTNGKTGTADFILQCGYSPVDDSCPGTDLDKGIGTNSCCYPRPQVVTATPVSGVGTWPRPGYISGICPNAKLSIRFNQVMSETSFTSSTLGFYNIILAEATTTPNCPSGTYWVGYQEKQPQNFWQKVKFVVSHWLGMPVAADTYCAGGLNYDLETRTNAHIINGDSVSSTVVSLILKEPLDSLKNYRLLATKDVTNYFKVKMQNPWMIDFTTASQLCKINQLSIDPDVYGFKRKDEEKVFAAKPEFLNESVNAPAQELLDMPGIYGWNYNWLDGDLAVNLINVNPVAGTNQATAAAVGNNGDTTLGAKVTITEDTSASSTVGKVFSASSTISVFICENPWPSSTIAPGLGLGYFDAAGNLNGIPVGLNWSNFKLLYCRDAGDVNVTADDISALSPVVLTHTGDTSGIFKEFFFTFNSVTNKNSIGLRVYPNTDHLSIADWYKTQPWIPKGAPTPAKVGSGDHVYESLQEGKTYYINGLNTSGSSVFTNVYVLAFSDNPNSETLNVIPQLLNEFTLNVNELDNKTKVSALTRDFTRFKDLKVVSEKLAASYNSKGFFPKLTENPQYSTFLPAYTNSKWQSWQLLSNSLGFGMPTDPINQFVNCGSSTLTVGVAPNVVNLNLFDSDTCWNAASSTFACLAGSHVFQYETSGGNSSIVKNDFEEPTMNWVNGLTNILNVKLCSLTKRACASDSECYQPKCVDSKCELTGTTCASDAVCATNPNTCTVAGVNFQLSGSCTGVVQGIGGRCGDGIVGVDEHGVTEQCEIGQTKYNSCTPSDDTGTPFINESLYPGKQLMQCNNTCTGFVSGGSSCVAQGFCGDGVKQGGEQCDKGDNNGKYGYSCDTHCRDLTNKCGDGIFQVSSEVCDLSTTQGVGFPAAWNLQESQSCSWDCQSRDYCGDGKVNFEHEECEKSEFCQVGKCLSSVFKQKINDSFIGGVLVSNNSNKYCEVNNNCSVVYEEPTNKIQVKTVCKKPENVCALSWFENGVESFLNHVVPDLIGGETIPCQTDNDCSGTCATPGSGKRYCAAPGENKYKKFVGPVFQDATTTASIAPSGVLTYTNTNKTCSWERTDLDVNYFSSTDVTCLPLSSVPTPISQLNCGVDADKDGSFKDPGEECDFGLAGNGDVPPTPGYGKTTTYCDFGCNLQTVSGPYCGDGNIQRSAGEVCDMTGCPYGSCTNSSTSQDNDTCSSDCKSFICPAGWTFHESSPGVCL